MAKRKQNINIVGRDANRRIERAIPKIQRELGYNKRRATATAIRMESVGQLSFVGKPMTAKQKAAGKMSVGVFAVSQLKRNRQPKKTVVVDTKPIKANTVGDYVNQYRNNVPLQFTTHKTKPKKKK